MFFLKEDTAADIKLGPFVDKGDGVTYEASMAAAMDHATTGVRLSKNGGAFADRHEGTEPTYDAFGYYLVKLSTTDTNTPGTLKVIFGDAAVCLPCEANFQIVSANVYDSLFAAATTDYLDVQVKAIDANAITAASINADAITEAKIADNAIAAEHLAANAIDFATFAADCKTGTGLKANVESISANAITATSINADAITNAKIADNAIAAENIAADAITAAKIANGAIDAATFAADVDAEILSYLVDDATRIDASALNTAAVTTIPAILEDTGTTIPGTITTIDNEIAVIDGIVDNILLDTAELQTDWVNGGRLDLLLDGAASAGDPWSTALPGAYGAGTAGLLVGTTIPNAITTIDNEIAVIDGIVDNILVDTNELQTDLTNGGRLDLILDGILEDTGTTIPGTITTVDNEIAVIDGIVDNILADTNELQTDLVNGGRLDLLVDAIKAKTDSLTYTVAGQVDANVQAVNDVTLTGDGSATPWGPA